MKIIQYIQSKIEHFLLNRTRPKMLYKTAVNGKMIKDTRIGSSTTIEGEKNLVLEENVFIGQYNFIEASNGIIIREGAQITNFISILSHSSHNSIRYYGKHYRKYSSDLKGYIKGSVEIGCYTFIGPHTTIMPDTVIGKGSIVAAYSFVRGNFPDFSIIAGNPAKVVGDTRENDLKFLVDYPELTAYYNEWAQEKK